MKLSQRYLSIAALIVGLLTAYTAPAQVLMLDFGSLNVSSGDPTNSPYHSVTPGFLNTSWNQIQTADVTAGGLVYSDGLTASGVSLDLGISTSNGSTVVNFGVQPLTSTSGTGGTGIFTGPSAGRDFVNSGPTGASNERLLGVGIGGLAAGTYDIYLVGMNTNLIGGSQFWAAAGSSSSSIDIGSLTSSTLTNSDTSAWLQGTNYVKMNVTITESNPELFLVAGGTSADLRGTFNAIQIVAVPEPSGLRLLAMNVLAVLVFWRRRRG